MLVAEDDPKPKPLEAVEDPKIELVPFLEDPKSGWLLTEDPNKGLSLLEFCPNPKPRVLPLPLLVPLPKMLVVFGLLRLFVSATVSTRAFLRVGCVSLLLSHAIPLVSSPFAAAAAGPCSSLLGDLMLSRVRFFVLTFPSLQSTALVGSEEVSFVAEGSVLLLGVSVEVAVASVIVVLVL